jgi:hypothetical protein
MNEELFLDLGMHYISDFYSDLSYYEGRNKYGLELYLDPKIKAVRLKEMAPHTAMWGKYWYRSGINQSMTLELNNIATEISSRISYKQDSVWLDIACNDGTMFKFMPEGVIKVGIDPCDDSYVAESSLVADHIVQDYFSYQAWQTTGITQKCKVITTIAMFYDLEDPIKFAEDVYELLDKDGIWHLELSYMPLMIKNLSYDTICHEHLEYYSLNSIKYIFDKVGFTIIDIQLNDINGGSFALTLSKNKNSNNKVVEWLLNQESKDNINNISTFKNFFLKISKQKKDLKNLLENLIDMKKKVYGYGASTKGNVILQFSNINSQLLPLIGEINPFKFNRYTPGTKIKIVSEAAIKKNKPDYLLVLPWHFKDFIIKKEKKYLDSGGKLIFPLPQIEII